MRALPPAIGRGRLRLHDLEPRQLVEFGLPVAEEFLRHAWEFCGPGGEWLLERPR